MSKRRRRRKTNKIRSSKRKKENKKSRKKLWPSLIAAVLTKETRLDRRILATCRIFKPTGKEFREATVSPLSVEI